MCVYIYIYFFFTCIVCIYIYTVYGLLPEIKHYYNIIMLPAIYAFTCGTKYTRADIDKTFNFLRLLSSLNLEKNGGVCLLQHK